MYHVWIERENERKIERQTEKIYSYIYREREIDR